MALSTFFPSLSKEYYDEASDLFCFVVFKGERDTVFIFCKSMLMLVGILSIIENEM